MIGRFGMAHACPVSGMILTAAHVAESHTYTGVVQKSYAYTIGGRGGYISPISSSAFRDLAGMRVQSGDIPPMNTLAETAAAQGDTVYWREWDLQNRVGRLELRKGEVSEPPEAGHFAFLPSPTPGASGGCVFNEAGDVVGILVWSVGITKHVGFAVDITGDWSP